MIKKISTLFILSLMIACSGNEESVQESEALAKQVTAVQVGREGLNNNFNATVSLESEDQSTETLSFKADFNTEEKNYVINENDQKPYVLHINCDHSDPLCNQAIIKIEGLADSPVPGTVTVEQFCLENPTMLPAIIGAGEQGEYDDPVFATLIKDLAVEIGNDFRGADPALSSRLVLRRIQKTDKHFYNLSIYRTNQHTLNVFQMRGVEGKTPIEFHTYTVVTSRDPTERTSSRTINISANTELTRHSVDGHFNYTFFLKFLDTASGKIPAVLNIELKGITGGFGSDGDDGSVAPAPFLFDWI